MFTQDFNPWSSKDKNAFEPFHDLQKITYEILQNTIHENMSLLNDNMSNYMRGMQLNIKHNRPEDLVKSQISLSIERGERACEYGKNLFKILENGLKEYRKCMEKIEGKVVSPFFKEATKVNKGAVQQEREKHNP